MTEHYVEYSLEDFIEALDLLDEPPATVTDNRDLYGMTGPRMYCSGLLGGGACQAIHALVWPDGLMLVSPTIWEIMK